MVSAACQPRRVEGWGSEGSMSGMWHDAPKEAVLGPCPALGLDEGEAFLNLVGILLGRSLSEEGCPADPPAHLQTLLSSMLSSSLTAQSATTTNSTSSSASGPWRRHRALQCMRASAGFAW